VWAYPDEPRRTNTDRLVGLFADEGEFDLSDAAKRLKTIDECSDLRTGTVDNDRFETEMVTQVNVLDRRDEVERLVLYVDHFIGDAPDVVVVDDDDRSTVVSREIRPPSVFSEKIAHRVTNRLRPACVLPLLDNFVQLRQEVPLYREAHRIEIVSHVRRYARVLISVGQMRFPMVTRFRPSRESRSHRLSRGCGRVRLRGRLRGRGVRGCEYARVPFRRECVRGCVREPPRRRVRARGHE
jgi:hypothetical protein